jgi:uracil-DNA glycosylase family 4
MPTAGGYSDDSAPGPKADGRDSAPPARAIKACKGRLIHDIKAHRPDAVLALGEPAASTLLDSKKGIRLLRGEGCQQSPYFDSPVVATFHPAAREPDKLAVMMSDVGKLVGCGESWR